ncbi:MAG: endopeptidase La [Acidobacteriota bacterium]|jgi:ATP-dependent Lon protease|nr:endopeptidase La [Acidobacteriota bacterium]
MPPEKRELTLPLIPLRELVTFPSTIIPILVGREKSINSLRVAAEEYNNYIFLSVQKNQLSDLPEPMEIYDVGVIARVEKSVEQNNGSFRVIIQGLERGRIRHFIDSSNRYLVQVEVLEDFLNEEKDTFELSKNLIALFEEYVGLRKVKLHGIIAKLEADKLSEICDIIVSVISVPLKIKQSLLEELDVYKRGVKVFNLLKKEVFKLKSVVRTDPQRAKEEPQESDVEEYRRKLQEAKLPAHVMKRAEEEVDRLSMMPPFSAEGTVSRYFLDWILAIPWTKEKRENKDIKRAAKVLDEDHYGLEKPKDRILDYLAVRQLSGNSNGEILCFVGPPGVGKSSISRSIARALDREFTRVSLGGVKDEAEIRGHRRTYIGSYPGQIIKGLKKAGVRNPVFLLDEIDKLSSDFRGDPASALLEVLDPEQNHEFVDHYLDLEIDLSKVFFITTANSAEPIPPALLDRMEIIELPGYTEREKCEIARRYLIPKQSKKAGLDPECIDINDDLLLAVINEYTREAGVRNLERQVAMMIRKVAREVVEKNDKASEHPPVKITREKLEKFLGVPRFTHTRKLMQNEVGVAMGLAWTVTGGDILIIEARFLKGKGELILTGRLGEVMKESSSTAFSCAKLKLFELDFDTDGLEKYNIHLHIPEGAVPKEGPSAGITLTVAMVSLLTGIPVRAEFAMTGEITLRGQILQVGGIKEKVLAAHRYGIRHVLLPRENEKDFREDIPEDIRNDMKIYFVQSIDEVLDLVLEKPLKIKNISSKVIKPFLDTKLQ